MTAPSEITPSSMRDSLLALHATVEEILGVTYKAHTHIGHASAATDLQEAWLEAVDADEQIDKVIEMLTDISDTIEKMADDVDGLEDAMKQEVSAEPVPANKCGFYGCDFCN